jgi:hypothetical protein
MPFGLETLVWTLAAGNIQPLFIWPSWRDGRGNSEDRKERLPRRENS